MSAQTRFLNAKKVTRPALNHCSGSSDSRNLEPAGINAVAEKFVHYVAVCCTAQMAVNTGDLANSANKQARNFKMQIAKVKGQQ